MGNDKDKKSEAIAASRLMGSIAGKARYQRDEARAQSETDYFKRFCQAYPKEWKREFEAAFKAGYKEESTPRGPIAY